MSPDSHDVAGRPGDDLSRSTPRDADPDGLGGYIRSRRLAAHTSLRQLSRNAGVSNPYLSQIERGIRRPSAEILQAIAKALGISPEVLYVRAGILEERVGGVDVERAIDDDPRLSAAQRRALRGVYQAFVGEAPT